MRRSCPWWESISGLLVASGWMKMAGASMRSDRETGICCDMWGNFGGCILLGNPRGIFVAYPHAGTHLKDEKNWPRVCVILGLQIQLKI